VLVVVDVPVEADVSVVDVSVVVEVVLQEDNKLPDTSNTTNKVNFFIIFLLSVLSYCLYC